MFLLIGVLSHTLTFTTLILAAAGDDDRPARVPEQAWQIATGLLGAAAAGITGAALLGWIAGLSFTMPSGPYLRWAILPLLPIIACVAAAAALTLQSRIPPGGGWEAWLAFPPTSIIFTAVGMLAMQYAFVNPSLAGATLPMTLLERLGACLFGLGIAAALTTRRRLQIIVSAPLVVFCAALVSPFTINVFAVIYAFAAATRYAIRLWQYGLHTRRPAKSGLPPIGVR